MGMVTMTGTLEFDMYLRLTTIFPTPNLPVTSKYIRYLVEKVPVRVKGRIYKQSQPGTYFHCDIGHTCGTVDSPVISAIPLASFPPSEGPILLSSRAAYRVPRASRCALARSQNGQYVVEKIVTGDEEAEDSAADLQSDADGIDKDDGEELDAPMATSH